MAPKKTNQKAAKQPAKTGDLTKLKVIAVWPQNDRASGHTPRQVSFFMFWANEQPPSEVSAMALRHNVKSPLWQRHATPQKGFTSKTEGPPECQLRRGIEPRLHKLRQKKTNKKPRKAPKRTERKHGYPCSRPIKATAHKETTQDTNNTKCNSNNSGSLTHQPESARGRAHTEKTEPYQGRGLA